MLADVVRRAIGVGVSFSVQSGTTQLDDSEDSVDQPIEPVDTGSAFLVCTARTVRGDVSNYRLRGRLIDPSVLRFDKGGGLGDIWIEWFIVESPSFVVQQVNLNIPDGDISASEPIDTVEASGAFVVASWRSSGTTIHGAAVVSVRLSPGGDEVVAERVRDDGDLDVCAFIVEAP